KDWCCALLFSVSAPTSEEPIDSPSMSVQVHSYSDPPHWRTYHVLLGLHLHVALALSNQVSIRLSRCSFPPAGRD
ncbi:hypothetical protein BDZ89DRAFT_1058866, partial [Hymenopellis radicata]